MHRHATFPRRGLPGSQGLHFYELGVSRQLDRALPNFRLARHLPRKKAFPLNEAKWLDGGFANQNIVCRLRHPATLDFLEKNT